MDPDARIGAMGQLNFISKQYRKFLFGKMNVMAETSMGNFFYLFHNYYLHKEVINRLETDIMGYTWISFRRPERFTDSR